ncbi:MAG: DsbA family oxidoreductase [Candidatus Kariarchaeaceae archaeon]|jgi:predicted DsbA family dithiol-disulfide isomerase
MKIDVYFDTICPWCWVGKHNLDKALELWNGERIEVNYKTFFLDETIPEGGVPSEGRLQKKYGMTDQQLKEYLERLHKLGLESGVVFEYDKIKITPNTIASHMLINLVPENNRSEAIERIFYEFFNQGQDIGDIEFLKALAKDFNVDIQQFEKNLHDVDKKEEVLRDVNIARYMGVQGVPFYIINDKYAISGAQKPEIIVQALNNVKLKESSIELM